MDWPGRDDLASIVLLALAGLVTTITGLWRGWFGARRDVRSDHQQQTIHGTYEDIINGLRAEISRLRADLADEQRLRKESEQRVEVLQRRVELLQVRCDALTLDGE